MLVLERDWRLVCIKNPGPTLRWRIWKQRRISPNSWPQNPPVIMKIFRREPTTQQFIISPSISALQHLFWLHDFALMQQTYISDYDYEKSWEAATTSAFHLTIWPCRAWVTWMVKSHSDWVRQGKYLLFWALASAVPKYPGMICEASPGNNKRCCWLADGKD